MNNSRFDRESSNIIKNKKSLLKPTSFIVLGALIAALMGIATLTFSKLPTTAVGLAQSQKNRKGDKKYIATKNVVVDRETGRARKPNDQELEELVDNLKELTKRSTEDLKSAEVAGSGDAIDLDGGFAGVMLSRPNADGTLETRCVFTFEEAAAFLGIEEENSL